jgi:tRNA (adenine57-N1/adenine58-N1)-methyltransferase catalytic subunit
MIKKVLVRNGKKFYWREGDIHSQFGVIKAKDIEKAERTIKTHSGKEFAVYTANFIDQLKKIKRGPQTLVLKDLGYILVHSGVNKDSFVVDAGSGCGVIAALLGKYAKKVVSYDIREDHSKIAKRNLKFLGVNNVELKIGDVYEGISERNVDILTLDLAEPWNISFDCMKKGGMIIVYLPTIIQVSEFCEKADVYVDKVVELIEREWHVKGRKVRPESSMLGHTAFLIIARKY